MYGSEDHLECLSIPPNLREAYGPQHFNGAVPCLGHKFTVKWAGLPYWVSDDGYVVTTASGKTYIALDAPLIAELQASNYLPATLPGYEVPIGWRLGGLSLWAILAIFMIFGAVKLLRTRRVRAARRGAATSELVIARAGDREIQKLFAPILAPDERITHQALAYDRKPDSVGASLSGKAHLIALTNHRLFISTTNIGLFGFGKGERVTTVTDRDGVSVVAAGDDQLYVERHNAPALTLVVPLTNRRYTASNQIAFLADLPRLNVLESDAVVRDLAS